MSTTITPTEQTIDINVTEDVIDINVTNNIVDVNATTEQINIEVAGAYPLPATVYSVFGRVGDVLALSGDYNTSLVTENTNLYFTNARARGAISLTTTGTSGAATYNSSTGVLNVPQYQGGVTSFNTRTGAISLTSADVSGALSYVPYNSSNPSGYITGITSGNVISALGYTPYNASNPNGYISGITSGNVTTALGYTPVTNARTLTINGTTYDLTADRSWTITGGVSSVFGRTGTVVATSGDYTTTQVTEGTNLYYTDLRARASLSFTAGSGTYNSTTGVITIPTNNNQITNGSSFITLLGLSATTPLSYNNTTGVFTITQASASANGYLASGDFTTFNNKLSTSTAASTYVPYTGATGAVNLGSNNLSANNAFLGFSSISASGTQLVLTIASAPTYIITGSGGQTIKLPDATTLPNGANYVFNNNQSSGVILVNNNSNTLVVSIPSGGYCTLELTDNSIAAGSWDRHFEAPSNVNWSTNTLDYAGSITSATWNGNAVAVNRGGTGQSTYTDGQLLIGNSTGNTLTKATLGAGTGITITNGGGSISIASSITQYTDALTRASISLTTTGSSGASTYSNTTGVLNVPNYTLSGLGGQPLATNLTSLAALSYASASFVKMTASGTFALDTNTYQGSLTLTTTGTSGAATLVGNTLNIPQYSGAGGGSMAIGGSITSATAGSVLYAGASGVLAQSNANFYYDYTNNRLGLGTTSPAQKLEVYNGSISVNGLTSASPYIGFSEVGTPKGYMQFIGSASGISGRANTLEIETAASIPICFRPTGTESARFDASANFGLGTTTIGSKLQVNGNAAIGYSASTAAPTNGLAVSGAVAIGQSTVGSGIKLDILGANGVLQATGNGIGDTVFILKNTAATFNNSLFYGVTTNTGSGFRLLDLRTNNGSNEVFTVFGNGATTIAGDTSISGVLRATITTNRQTASYTLVLADRGKLVEMNVATANNLTIPLNSSVAFPIGTQIDLSQYGAGQTTVVATGGVTIRSTNSWVKLNAQYAAATLIKIGTDEWYLFGNLNA
jgi:hypothetical protein